MTVDLRCCDALDMLRSLPDKSVNLIATDPPYFRVKGEAWDNAWKDAGAFLSWLGELADEWRRVLTDNGTLYCFASPQMAARVQVLIAERFDVLNEVVWVKVNGWHMKADAAALRGFFPQTERIVVAQQHGADGSVLRSSGYASVCQELHAGVFEPLRQYLITERDRAGWTNRQVDELLGTNGMAGHFFGASQWSLPTEAHYNKMRDAMNAGTGAEVLRREYEDLRREYEDLRREYEDLRRPFTVTADVPYTDVWTFPTVPPSRKGAKRHPCAKPIEMMEHIIRTSSRDGDTVLDCFLGGGATAIAAQRLGRDFVGCDMEAEWVDVTRQRLAADEARLFAA